MNSIGIIGFGAFGALLEMLIRMFAPQVRIMIFSRVHRPDGERFFDLESVAQCDVVILAVPIRAYEDVLIRLTSFLRDSAILVDIATVKVYTSDLIERLFPTHRRLHIHPMFGPGSFKKSGGKVDGFPIVVTGHSLPPAMYAQLVKFAKKLGFDLVKMTAEQHDKRLAETLFIAHLQSQTLKRAGFLKHTRFDTPSVRLMKESAQIISNDTELFRDVVHFNPFCRDAMIRWQKAQSFIWRLLADAK